MSPGASRRVASGTSSGLGPPRADLQQAAGLWVSRGGRRAHPRHPRAAGNTGRKVGRAAWRGGQAADAALEPSSLTALRARQLQGQPLPQLPALLLRDPDDVQHGLALQAPGGSLGAPSGGAPSGHGPHLGAQAPPPSRPHPPGQQPRGFLPPVSLLSPHSSPLLTPSHSLSDPGEVFPNGYLDPNDGSHLP